MHDGDVLARDLVDGDITGFKPSVWRVDEEEEVPSVKCGFHGAAEDNNDRRLCVRDQSETLPNHKAGCEDRGKVEDLKQDMAKAKPSKSFEFLREHLLLLK